MSYEICSEWDLFGMKFGLEWRVFIEHTSLVLCSIRFAFLLCIECIQCEGCFLRFASNFCSSACSSARSPTCPPTCDARLIELLIQLLILLFVKYITPLHNGPLHSIWVNHSGDTFARLWAANVQCIVLLPPFEPNALRLTLNGSAFNALAKCRADRTQSQVDQLSTFFVSQNSFFFCSMAANARSDNLRPGLWWRPPECSECRMPPYCE